MPPFRVLYTIRRAASRRGRNVCAFKVVGKLDPGGLEAVGSVTGVVYLVGKLDPGDVDNARINRCP